MKEPPLIWYIWMARLIVATSRINLVSLVLSCTLLRTSMTLPAITDIIATASMTSIKVYPRRLRRWSGGLGFESDIFTEIID